MHFLMVLIGLIIACGIRVQPLSHTGIWTERWQRALILFLLPPLLLMMTAIAVVCMGWHGSMVWWWEGWLCYGMAIGFLSGAGLLGLYLCWQGRQMVQQLHRYPIVHLSNGQSARLLQTPKLYSAQVGFWKSELVVSQGLLDKLDSDHLQAVFVHEQAHAKYHDTFWFFWLGWLRRLTLWLPQTEALWQELLMLRELRADRQAAAQVDPLLLAESLLLIVSAPMASMDFCAAFGEPLVHDRLTERIEALLSPESMTQGNDWFWLKYGWSLLPLIAIPFHVG